MKLESEPEGHPIRTIALQPNGINWSEKNPWAGDLSSAHQYLVESSVQRVAFVVDVTLH